MRMEEQHNSTICLNCENTARTGDIYCSKCAQKLRGSRISVKVLFVDFIVNFFNWDSRLIHTIAKMFVPGKLTSEYISGKRKMYLNPARIFLLSLLIFFGLVAIYLNSVDMDFGDQDAEKRIAKAELLEQFDSISTELQLSSDYKFDSLKSRLFKDAKPAHLDSFSIYGDQSLFGLEIKELKILRKDLNEMKPKDVIEKYEVTGFIQRLGAKQTIKIIQDPGSTFQFAVGNMLWGIFAQVFILALLMKLLYWRRRKYYVEHLVFLFHTFSIGFFLMIPSLMTQIITGEESPAWLEGLLGLAVLVYAFIALKKYYKQGIIKTFIKFWIIFFGNLIIGLFLLTIVVLISMITF